MSESKYLDVTETGAEFVRCFDSVEDYKEAFKELDEYTEEDFVSLHLSYLRKARIVAESAKLYILENWKKVKDWSDLEFTVRCTSGVHVFYNYDNHKDFFETSSKSDTFSKFLKKADKRAKEKHNPVKEITEVVLDPSDGDFSVTINGDDYLWIDDKSIITIAGYIEEKIKNNS